ncbi:hypothetical protein GQ55_2G170900 [Panicum hallii var. hallii]|uniref:Uncharacterized protein n=1 Tax=Panicum hallii var. hallii TaxID=1504633 RepID=A0A2T7EQ36_9POAL|nr:hypothetical protein GQ55_2G170900 [Panicum hallii var. hallii]
MQVELLRPMVAAGGRPRASGCAARLLGASGPPPVSSLFPITRAALSLASSSLSSVVRLLQLWRPLQCLNPAACNLFEQMPEWYGAYLVLCCSYFSSRQCCACSMIC